jgi:hypothetical protein
MVNTWAPVIARPLKYSVRLPVQVPAWRTLIAANSSFSMRSRSRRRAAPGCW